MLNKIIFGSILKLEKIISEENITPILIFIFTILFIRMFFPEKFTREELLIRQKMAEDYLNLHKQENEDFFF